jgi:hypothetical protein
MAPATDTTLSLYPPSRSNMSTTISHTSTASATRTAFVTLSLGRSGNAIELLVPSTPSVHDPMDLKARCFDYLAGLLLEHASLYSSAKLIAAFGHIPGSTYNTTLEATAVCSHLRSAFFHVTDLVGLDFRDRDGSPITGTIDSNLDTRPAGIYSTPLFHLPPPTPALPFQSVLSNYALLCHRRRISLPPPPLAVILTQALPLLPNPLVLSTPFQLPPSTRILPLPFLPLAPLRALTNCPTMPTNCYPSFSADQFRNLLLCSHTPTTSTVPNTLASQFPRIAAVLASAGSSTSGGHSY